MDAIGIQIRGTAKTEKLMQKLLHDPTTYFENKKLFAEAVNTFPAIIVTEDRRLIFTNDPRKISGLQINKSAHLTALKNKSKGKKS